MSLEAGDETAALGMSKVIYDKMKEVMEKDLPELAEADLNAMRKGWQKLAYCIASGVIEHIKSNMEIVGVQTQGNVTVTVQGNKGTATNVTFSQSNDGTGRVK